MLKLCSMTLVRRINRPRVKMRLLYVTSRNLMNQNGLEFKTGKKSQAYFWCGSLMFYLLI